MAGDKNNSGRVTTREFYDALIAQNEEAAKRERRMMGKIGTLTTSVNQIASQPAVCRAYMEGMNRKIDQNHTDIKETNNKLDEKADKINDRINGLRIWEGFNTVLATVLGYFGIRLGGA